MTGTIAAVISCALASIGAYFKWKSSSVNQRKLVEAEIAKENEQTEAKKEEIRKAVYTNDDEELTELVNKLLED